jgi:hypothetical protein
MSLVMMAGLVSLPLAAIAVFLVARGRHVLIGFGVGLLCVVPSYMIGVDRFCSIESAGNLCGLGAVFGTVPLGFSLGAVGYAVLSRFLSKDPKGTVARRGS